MPSREKDVATTSSDPLLISIADAGVLLGISASAAREFIRKQDIPIIRAGLGGRLFVPKCAVVRSVERLR